MECCDRSSLWKSKGLSWINRINLNWIIFGKFHKTVQNQHFPWTYLKFFKFSAFMHALVLLSRIVST
ncbi:hypothetical protein Y032_0025g1134 [Ancylostoma ceylanicum]|uniref:Uncharacterized protein n=1 Tax=Ancylostoma ceylanicum TaxID=53326 RepID=A0A016UUG1_9BILA|nr:hypothetical protein Y032_0025g1134 [Ancylostoma ceylanicum]